MNIFRVFCVSDDPLERVQRFSRVFRKIHFEVSRMLCEIFEIEALAQNDEKAILHSEHGRFHGDAVQCSAVDDRCRFHGNPEIRKAAQRTV